MKLYYIKLASVIYAIIGKDEIDATQKSLKYGSDGVIISTYKLNKDWN